MKGEVYWMSSTEILENKNAPIWLKESIEKVENIRLEIKNESASNIST